MQDPGRETVSRPPRNPDSPKELDPLHGQQSRSRRFDLLYGIGLLLAAILGYWAIDRSSYLSRLEKKGAVVNFMQPEDWGPTVPWYLGIEGPDFGNADLRLIETLPTLTRISAAGSRIDDQGIEMLSTLPNLREINLSITAITDKSLVTLTRSPRLREIDLSECPQLTSRGLFSLQGLPELRLLRLNGFPLTMEELHELDSEFPGVIHLHPQRFLGLSEDSPLVADWMGVNRNDRRFQIRVRLGTATPVVINESHFAPLRFPDKVESLELLHALLESGTIPALAPMTGLTRLQLGWPCRFDGQELPSLSQLPSLRELSIRVPFDAVWNSGDELPLVEKLVLNVGAYDSVGPLLVASCPGLKELHVSSRADMQGFLSAIAQLPQLRALYLSGNQLTDADLDQLTGLNTLETLAITSNNISPQGLSKFSTLPRLKHLWATGEQLPQGAGIPWLDFH